MAVDLNDEILMMGAFTQREFYWGIGGLAFFFVVFALGVSVITHLVLLGFGLFALTGGPWIFFWVYHRGLPKGYLMRRFRQEGKFFFFHLKQVRGPQIYSTPFSDRQAAWQKVMEAQGEQ